MASNVVSPQSAVRPNKVAHPKPPDTGPSFWESLWEGMDKFFAEILVTIFWYCVAYVSFIVFAVFTLLILVMTGEAERIVKTVLYMKQIVHQAFPQTRDAVAGGLASGLNGLLEHVNHFLQTAGIQVGLPIHTVTPEGVVFVAQWILLLLICYGVIAITFLLATFLLRWMWWLLKVGVALACFGLILKDHNVGIETTAMRLVCLGSVCILISIRPRKDRTMAAKIVHLEEQLKILEYRGREMEGWRRRFITLSCCVIGFLCLVFFIFFQIYIATSNSEAS